VPEKIKEVFSIASEFVDNLAALDPFSATEMGVPGHDHEVPDFSPGGLTQRMALNRRALDRLQGARVVTRDDQVAAAIMQDALNAEFQRFEAGDQYYDLRPIASPIQSLQEIFELMPRDTDEAWRNIVHRSLPRLAGAGDLLQGR
jgi:hypothetical protein